MDVVRNDDVRLRRGKERATLKVKDEVVRESMQEERLNEYECATREEREELGD